MANLRPYQKECIASMEAVLHKHFSQLVHMATGVGKTHVATYFMLNNFRGKRVLWLAHTRELIHQARNTCVSLDRSMNSRVMYEGRMVPNTGIVQGARNSTNARWVYATMQTVARKERLRLILAHGAPDLIVIDEAHHATCGSLQDNILKTIVYYKICGDFDEAWKRAAEDEDTVLNLMKKVDVPDMHVVGLTATPKRADRKALHQVFDVVSYRYTLVEAIKDGYLKPFTAVHAQSGIDLRDVPISPSTGDFVESDLLEVLEANNWVELVSQIWMEKAKGRKTVVFMPSVNMSREFAIRMNQMGFKTGHIDFKYCIDSNGKTQKDLGISYWEHRANIIQSFRDEGDDSTMLLCGFNALLEGFDSAASAAIWARMTTSDTLLTQAVGRILRTHPGVARQLYKDEQWYITFDNGDRRVFPEKEVPFDTNALVIDLVGTEASLLVTADIFGNMATPAKKEIEEEEQQGEDEETTDLHDPEDLKEVEQELLFKTHRGYYDADGRVYTYTSLYASSTAHWYVHADYTQSVRLDHGLGLFIHPPYKAVVAQCRSRIQKREAALAAGVGDDELLSQQITDYYDLINLFSQHSLWRVYAPTRDRGKNDKGYDVVDELWHSKDAQPRLLGVYGAMAEAVNRSFPYADQWLSDQGILFNKRKAWHSKRISDGMRKLLTTGDVGRIAREYSIGMPPVEDMRAGVATQLRFHVYAYAQILRTLHNITASKHIDQDIWWE